MKNIWKGQKIWSKKNFQEGLPWGALLYGYRVVDNVYYIVEDEAKVVKMIFQFYLDGLGKEGIARKLNSLGYRTRVGAKWSDSSVRQILDNYDYTGNLILQKTYRLDYISKKTVINHGELPKYHVEESHEPIIDMDTWNKVQEEIKRRNAKIKRKVNPVTSPFKGKIKCGCCGKNFLRKESPYRTFWACSTYQKLGVKACPCKRIDEEELINIIEQLEIQIDSIKEITINSDFTLYILNKDGREFCSKWKVRSRRDSWTPEMREKARQREMERQEKLWQE